MLLQAILISMRLTRPPEDLDLAQPQETEKANQSQPSHIDAEFAGNFASPNQNRAPVKLNVDGGLDRRTEVAVDDGQTILV